MINICFLRLVPNKFFIWIEFLIFENFYLNFSILSRNLLSAYVVINRPCKHIMCDVTCNFCLTEIIYEFFFLKKIKTTTFFSTVGTTTSVTNQAPNFLSLLDSNDKRVLVFAFDDLNDEASTTTIGNR